MRALAQGDDGQTDAGESISDVIVAAQKAIDAPRNGKDQCGAGVGFLYAVQILFEALAASKLGDPILDGLLRKEEKSARKDLKDYLAKNESFRASMRMPKAAARQLAA